MSQRSLAPLLGRLGFDPEASDRDLLEVYLLDRDQGAFATLVKRHGPRVLAACRRVLQQPADVEDAFQATFLILLNRARSVRWEPSLGGWLMAVAHRVAVRTRSRVAQRQMREVSSNVYERAGADGVDLLWPEACAILHEELDRLPEAFRRPLVLCYFEGLSRDEAAQSLGCSLDTVKGRLERGRARLRGRLERRGISFSAGLLGVLGATAVGSSAANAAAVSLPRPLVQATLRAASTGQTSARVAALVQGVGSMMHGHFRLALLALLAVGLVSGAGLWLFAGAPRLEEPAKTSAAKAGEASKDDTADRIEVRGTVVTPEGKPCANAQLYVPRLKKSPPTSRDDLEMARVGVTGPDGKFRITAEILKELNRTFVVAQAPGYGIEFVERDQSSSKEPVTLKLVADQPIVGRLLDTEGKPVSGVRIEIGSVQVPNEGNLDSYLNGWKKNWRDTMSLANRQIYMPGEPGKAAVTSDKDGRFRLTGAGKDRVVLLNLEGANVAQSTPYVITRPGFDPKAYNEAAAAQESGPLGVRSEQPVLFGPELTMVVVRGRAIEGVVKDTDGKPLVGVRVMAAVGYGGGVMGSSDRDGKYRLNGLPPEKQYQLFFNPPEASAHLRTILSVEATPGTGPVHLDAELVKGVLVTGRVLDRQTGKGVHSAFRFAPLPKNTYFSKPGFDGYRRDRTVTMTDNQGRFRTATIPGESLMMVQATAREHVNGQEMSPYRTATPEMEHKDLFRYVKEDDTWLFDSAGGMEFLSTETAVKVVDLKENVENHVEIFVERGKTAPIVLQDADGKPLSGVIASGMTQHWPGTFKLDDSKATVLALDPAKPRRLVFLHVGKKLGGVAVVRGDEKEPVVVRLSPLGSIKGRFVDSEGAPLNGAVVSPASGERAISELYRFLARSLPEAKTDQDGRFTLEHVVPGVGIGLQTRKGETYYTGEPRVGEQTVQAGATLELGERKMKRVR